MALTSKIEGVVLSTVRYGDSNIVVNILTPDEGRRAYIVGASSGSRRSTPSAMLLPLSLVEFVASSRRKGSMARMSAVRLRAPFRAIPFDPVLRAEALFMAELVAKAVPQEVPDRLLYDFVVNSVEALDAGIPGVASFHLLFMMRLADYLGFGPEPKADGCDVFDLEAGVWCSAIPTHPYSLTGRAAEVWDAISSASVESLASLRISRVEKREAIDTMATYFRLHTPNFGQLQSHIVLAQLAD